MNENSVVHRRDLPHIDVEGKPSFITACSDGMNSEAGIISILKNLQDDQRAETQAGSLCHGGDHGTVADRR